MNTPGQQELWKGLGFGELPEYAHMSVTISEGGGELSKRERPKALRKTIKARKDIDLKKLAKVSNLTLEEVETFLIKDLLEEIERGQYKKSEIAVIYDDKIYGRERFAYDNRALPMSLLRKMESAHIPTHCSVDNFPRPGHPCGLTGLSCDLCG